MVQQRVRQLGAGRNDEIGRLALSAAGNDLDGLNAVLLCLAQQGDVLAGEGGEVKEDGPGLGNIAGRRVLDQ